MSWLTRLIGYSRPERSAGTPSVPAAPGRGGPIPTTLDMGNYTVEQVHTFNALLNSFGQTYSFRYDEAMRQDPAFAMKIRRDCFIRALLQERLMPLTRWKWSLVPPDPEHKEQADRAKWYEAVVRKTPKLSRQLLYLGQAAWYGRYGSQLAFTEDTIEGKPGWRVLKHSPVNGDKLVFGWDGTPGVMVDPQTAFRFPREDVTYTDRGAMVLRLLKPEYRQKFIIHQHELDDADYFEPEMAGRVEGIGLRDFVYYGAFLRAELIKWAVAFMEKVGTLGLLIFRYPEGNAQAKKDAEQAARAASHRTAIAIPVPKGGDKNTSSAELLPANMTGVQFLVKIISGWWERHVERLFVGQSMSSGSDDESGLGGSGRAKFAEDTKFNLLQFDATIVAETLTEDLLPVLETLNGDEGFGLRWVFALPDPQAKDKLEAVTKAASLPGKKLTFLASEIRNLTGLSEPGPDDEVVGGDETPAGQTPGTPPGTPPASPAPSSPASPDSGAGAEQDPFESLFGDEPQTAQYAVQDWIPHTLEAGPRKGQSVWKNRQTGEVRDQPPTEAESKAEDAAKPKGSSDQPDPAAARQHARGLLSRAAGIPAAIKDRVASFVANKYASLSERYGPTGAKAILAGAVLLTPIPLPGTSLLPVAFAEGVKRLYTALKGTTPKPTTTPEKPLSPVERTHEATNLLHEVVQSAPEGETKPEPKPTEPPPTPTPESKPAEDGAALFRRAQSGAHNLKPAEVEQLGEHLPTMRKESLQVLAIHWKLKQSGNKADLIARLMEHAHQNASSIDFKHKDANHPVAKMIRRNPRVRDVMEAMQAHFDAVKAAKAHEAECQATNRNAALKARAMKEAGDPDADRHANEVWAPASEAYKAAREKADALAAQTREKLVEALKPSEPGTVAGTFDHSVNPTLEASLPDYQPVSEADQARARTAYDPAMKFVESVCDRMGNVPIVFGTSKRGRAWAQKARHAGGSHNVALISELPTSARPQSTQQQTETAVHEIGHVIEFTKPNLASEARAFVEYRCAGEPEVKLSEAFPGSSYGADEAGRKDQFDRAFDGSAAYYVGKAYKSGDTEVISMGLEKMYHDPTRFFEKDPEYAAFMVHVLTS